MASLSSTSPAEVSILPPLMSYRFRVSFHEDGVKLPFSDNIAMQVIKTSSFTDGSGCIMLTVEDDALNVAAKGIQRLLNLQNFQLVIDYLNNVEEVIKTATLDFCMVSHIEHGRLDYAGKPSTHNRLKLNIPLKEGSLITALNENPAARAVIALLNGSSVIMESDSSPSTVQTVLSISYDHVKLTFPESS